MPARSPVFIGGYCNGGLVAWHLAYLLRARESRWWSFFWSRRCRSMRGRLFGPPRLLARRARWCPARRGDSCARRHARAVVRQEGGWGFPSVRRRKIVAWWQPAAVGGAMHSTTRIEMYHAFMSRYVPPPIDVDVTCFIAEEGRHFETDPTFWRCVAPSVRQGERAGYTQRRPRLRSASARERPCRDPEEKRPVGRCCGFALTMPRETTR